jgi:microcystin-dependent protein
MAKNRVSYFPVTDDPTNVTKVSKGEIFFDPITGYGYYLSPTGAVLPFTAAKNFYESSSGAGMKDASGQGFYYEFSTHKLYVNNDAAWSASTFDPTKKANVSGQTFTGIPTVPTPDINSNDKTIPNTAWITTNLNKIFPTGSIMFFMGSVPPQGWLKLNGSALNRTNYVNLFNVIGTTYGAGDGFTTFNIPDMRSIFPRAWDDGRGVDPSRGFGSYQPDGYISHSHNGSSDQQAYHSHAVYADTQGYHAHNGWTDGVGDHQHDSAWGEKDSAGPWGNSPIRPSMNNLGSAKSDTDDGWIWTGAAGGHTHSIGLNGAGNHAHNVGLGDAGNHAHNVSIYGNAVAAGVNESRPYNMALLCCIKA